MVVIWMLWGRVVNLSGPLVCARSGADVASAEFREKPAYDGLRRWPRGAGRLAVVAR